MKLISRYTWINIALVVVVLLISCIFLKILIKKTLVHEIDEDFEKISANIELYVQRTQSVPDSSILYDYSLSCTEIKQPGQPYSITILRYIPAKNGSRYFRQHVFYINNKGSWYMLNIEKQVEGIRIMGRTLIGLTLLTMLFMTGLIIIINKMVLTRLWNPFYQTLSIMRSFQLNKHINLDFPKSNIEEFTYMNDTLKQAMQKAGQDYVALKEFTENASHELQTPLSIIRSKLDILIQDAQMSERQNQTIVGAYTALTRMAHLNQSLLLLAKIGNAQFSNINKIALHEKLAEKTGQFRELWQDQGLAVKENISASYISINPDLCDILINNLFSNATNHNVPGGFINITLSQGQFVIGNSGPGAALDPQKIFSRFYKSDQSSVSNGLGLSIIKQICEASHITIHYTFQNAEHIFTLSWLV